MLNVGTPELLVILVVALLILGPTKLPEAARQVGRAVAELRRLSSGFQDELKSAMQETPIPRSPTPLATPRPSDPGDHEAMNAAIAAAREEAIAAARAEGVAAASGDVPAEPRPARRQLQAKPATRSVKASSKATSKVTAKPSKAKGAAKAAKGTKANKAAATVPSARATKAAPAAYASKRGPASGGTATRRGTAGSAEKPE